MYGNPAFDCDGAQIRSHCRQLATVVTITGAIDGANVDRVHQYIKRFVLPEKPFVLDLSGLNSFAVEGISLLYAVDDDCRAAGVEWSLIASSAVNWALRVSAEQIDAPAMNSVPDALNHFAEAILERRRLLPLLTKTA